MTEKLEQQILENLSYRQRRAMAPMLLQYHWSTMIVTQGQAYGTMLEVPFDSFGENLDKFEEEIFVPGEKSSGAVAILMRRLHDDGTAVTDTVGARNTVVEYLTTLQLADVVHFTKALAPEEPTPRPKRSMATERQFKPLENLDSIKGLVEKFLMPQIIKAIPATTTTPTSGSSSDGAASDTARHLERLGGYIDMKNFFFICTNVSKAVIYLQYFLSDNWRKESFTVWVSRHLKLTKNKTPYLKKLEADFKSSVDQSSVAASGSELAVGKTKKQGEDKKVSEKDFRRPLFLALHLTPLLLLLPQRLDSKNNGKGRKYSEWEMIEDAGIIGDHSVEVIKESERIIWDTLLNIASSGTPVDEALSQMHKRLPWDLLRALPGSDDRALSLSVSARVESDADKVTPQGSNSPKAPHVTLPSVPQQILTADDLVVQHSAVSAGASVISRPAISGLNDPHTGPGNIVVHHSAVSTDTSAVSRSAIFGFNDPASVQAYTGLGDIGNATAPKLSLGLATATTPRPLEDSTSVSLSNTLVAVNPLFPLEHHAPADGLVITAIDPKLLAFPQRVGSPSPSCSAASETSDTGVLSPRHNQSRRSNDASMDSHGSNTPAWLDRGSLPPEMTPAGSADGHPIDDPDQLMDLDDPPVENGPEDESDTSTEDEESTPLTKKRPATTSDEDSAKSSESGVSEKATAAMSSRKLRSRPIKKKTKKEEQDDFYYYPQQTGTHIWLDRAVTPFMAGYVPKDEIPKENEPLVVKSMTAEMLQSCETRTLRFANGKGEFKEFNVMFTDHDDGILFQELVDGAESCYVNGVPPHALNTTVGQDGVPLSAVRVMTHSEYKSMTPRELQKIFRFQHILVRDCPVKEVPFTPDGLKRVCNLCEYRTINDFTLSKDQEGGRHTSGTIYQIWQNSQLPNPKPLSSLDNPCPSSKQDDIEGLATCVQSFNNLDKHNEGETSFLPVSSLYWNLVATTNANTSIHKDSDGAGTMVRSVHGLKAWAMIRNSGRHNPRKFSTTRFYDFFELDRVNKLREAGFDIEIVLLELTDMLMMHPNTHHAVLTLSNAIFEGAHFHTLTSMRDTLSALIDTLSRDEFITNASHSGLRLMIRKIVHYVHRCVTVQDGDYVDASHCFDRDNLNADDMLDLLAVISCGILCNILDPQTYCYHPNAGKNEQLTEDEQARMDRYDYNSMTMHDRVACVATRAMAFELADWLVSTYELVRPNGREADMSCRQIVYTGLAFEAFGVYMSLKLSTHTGMSSPNVTLESIEKRLLALPGPAEFKNQISAHFDLDTEQKATNTLFYWEEMQLSPVLKEGIQTWVRGPGSDLFEDGQCHLDKLYFGGVAAGFPL